MSNQITKEEFLNLSGQFLWAFVFRTIASVLIRYGDICIQQLRCDLAGINFGRLQ